MPDEDRIAISDLSTPLSLDATDVVPVVQDMGGSPRTMGATVGQLASKTGEGTTFSNLDTQAKNLVPAINEVKSNIPANSDFSLSGLLDTAITTPTANQVLAHDGSKWVNSNDLANKLDKSALKYIVGTGTTDANGILTSTAMGVVQLNYDNHIILAVQSSYNGTCVNVGQYNKNFYYVCTNASGLATPIANTSVTIRIIYMDKWW